MRIIIDMGHPAHVHLFKNIIWGLNKKGHRVLVTARNKEVTIDLLKAYNFEYIPVGEIGSSKFDLIREWINRDYEILKIARKFNPDILMGMSNPCVAHASWILGKKAILLDDSEVTTFSHKITYPFANVICTPSLYKKDLGKKQVRYDGYHELAYLNPKYFTPDPSVLEYFGLKESDKYVILRFVSWGANHDVGHQGLSLEDKRKAVHEIEKHGRVFITSEKPLPDDLEKYRISASPEKMHDLLFYAQVFFGDSQTMTTEAAILGTPAIRCNSFVGENDMSNFKELENKYGLIFNYSDPKKALEKAIELLHTSGIKEKWVDKKEQLLRDKIDVTGFITWFIENYPDSFPIMKENPNFQFQFKVVS